MSDVTFRTCSGYLDNSTRRRLSPFDLILEILDDDKPEYSFHRTEFYKEGNEKLAKILDAILSSGPGKIKLGTWMQRPATFDTFRDVITQEMNVTPRFSTRFLSLRRNVLSLL